MSMQIKVVHQDNRVYIHLSKSGNIFANIGLNHADALLLTKKILGSMDSDYAVTNLYFEDGGFGIGKDGEDINAD